MAVDASALIEPAGPLTTSLFPGEDSNALTARVGAYLAAAATDARVAAIVAGDGTKADEAATAYALWRSYRAVVQRMNTEPITVNVTEKGSHTYSMAQLAAMQALVDSYDQQLDSMLPPVPDTATPAMSTSVANSFVW